MPIIDITEPDTAPPARPPRRSGIGVAVAALVVLATLAVIVVVGYVPLPAMPSLAADPDPRIAGSVAYVHGDWESSCVAVVPAGGGEPTDVVCELPVPQSLAWTAEGHLLVAGWFEERPTAGTATVHVLDPATGRELDQVAMPADGDEGAVDWAMARMERPDGSRLVVPVARDGVATLRVRAADGTMTEILRLDGPADYGIASAQWSPDGAWVLASDTRGRVFVVAADGDPGPRLVVETGGRDTPMVPPAWWMTGDATYTVEVDDVGGGP